jgi:hypothetical protein
MGSPGLVEIRSVGRWTILTQYGCDERSEFSKKRIWMNAEVHREAEEGGDLELESLTQTMIGCAIRVQRALGPGLLLNFWCWSLKAGGIQRILNPRTPPLSSVPPPASA